MLLFTTLSLIGLILCWMINKKTPLVYPWVMFVPLGNLLVAVFFLVLIVIDWFTSPMPSTYSDGDDFND